MPEMPKEQEAAAAAAGTTSDAPQNERQTMTAQDDSILFRWLNEASFHAGDFLKSLANAGLRADAENYRQLRPVLFFMRVKYPQYATMGDDEFYVGQSPYPNLKELATSDLVSLLSEYVRAPGIMLEADVEFVIAIREEIKRRKPEEG